MKPLPHAKFRAGWGVRAETLEEGTRKVLKTLNGFGMCFPDLRQWSFQDPPFVPAPLKPKYISRMLEESVRRRKFSDLGYSLHAWTGTKKRAFGLFLRLGSTYRDIGNRLSLAFPPQVRPNVTTAKCLLATIVRVWEPEFAAFNPAVNEKEHRFEFGELCYLSPETEQLLGDLPGQGVRREPFELGHLYTLNPREIKRLYEQAHRVLAKES